MPIYLVELTDGRKFRVDADRPPSAADIEAYLNTQNASAAPAPQRGAYKLSDAKPIENAKPIGEYSLSDITTPRQQTYHVTAPDGRKLTIKGDHMPTEAELIDIFAKAPGGSLSKPVSAEDFETPAQPEGSALGRFASNAWQMVNPIEMVKGAAHVVAHPIDTVTGLAGAQIDQGAKALEAARAGHYSEAMGHGFAAALPIVGPVAANVGEQIGSGDVAGGLGAATGLIAGVASPGAVGRVKGVTVPGVASLEPAAADAVAFAERAGIPVDAATATGNKAIRAVQHVADRTLGGSAVGARASSAQARGLATVGEELAAKAYPASSVSAEAAGQGVRDAVAAELQGHAAEANAAYDALRQIEADPKNLRTVTVMQEGRTAAGDVVRVPVAQQMPLPVDLRPAKQAFKPIYDSLKRESELAPASMMGDKARALVALDKIMTGPTHAPLSTVDAVLGDLKSFARSDVPELRTAGQGAVAGAIKHLDAVVRQTAAEAGPDVLDALRSGRQATIAKYGAAKVLETLNAEPVRTFQALTRSGDTAIEQLRDVAKQAPGELPKIGRAFLDGLIDTATADGGFSHAAKVASQWEKLGPETKRLLYKDPGYISDLDNFFRFARMSAETANASGTGHVVATLSHIHSIISGPVVGLGEQGAWAAISGLLHSKAGVRVLSKGLRIPLANKAAMAAYSGELSAAIGRLTSPTVPQKPAAAGAR